jgi:hypothetical protein
MARCRGPCAVQPMRPCCFPLPQSDVEQYYVSSGFLIPSFHTSYWLGLQVGWAGAGAGARTQELPPDSSAPSHDPSGTCATGNASARSYYSAHWHRAHWLQQQSPHTAVQLACCASPKKSCRSLVAWIEP